MDVASSSQEPIRLGHVIWFIAIHKSLGYLIPMGMRQLISDPIANSEVRIDHIDGVLKLILHPKSYEWEFVPVEGESFTDSGGAQCY
jgi:hypothetical protein